MKILASNVRKGQHIIIQHPEHGDVDCKIIACTVWNDHTLRFDFVPDTKSSWGTDLKGFDTQFFAMDHAFDLVGTRRDSMIDDIIEALQSIKPWSEITDAERVERVQAALDRANAHVFDVIEQRNQAWDRIAELEAALAEACELADRGWHDLRRWGSDVKVADERLAALRALAKKETP